MTNKDITFHSNLIALRGLLDAANAGFVPVSEPYAVGASEVGYTVGNVKIVVFDDAGDWDGIDHAILPSGRVIDFHSLEGRYAPMLQEWEPNDDVFRWASVFMGQLDYRS